jgi:hypothetical protein
MTTDLKKSYIKLGLSLIQAFAPAAFSKMYYNSLAKSRAGIPVTYKEALMAHWLLASIVSNLSVHKVLGEENARLFKNKSIDTIVNL